MPFASSMGGDRFSDIDSTSVYSMVLTAVTFDLPMQYKSLTRCPLGYRNKQQCRRFPQDFMILIVCDENTASLGLISDPIFVKSVSSND